MTCTRTTSIGAGTVQLFERLLDDLSREASQLGEQRGPERHAVQWPVTLGVMIDGEYRSLYRAWATDMSRLGMGVLTEHPLTAGLELFVNLETIAQRPCVLPIRVVYCRQLLSQTHRAGLALMIDEVEG